MIKIKRISLTLDRLNLNIACFFLALIPFLQLISAQINKAGIFKEFILSQLIMNVFIAFLYRKKAFSSFWRYFFFIIFFSSIYLIIFSINISSTLWALNISRILILPLWFPLILLSIKLPSFTLFYKISKINFYSTCIVLIIGVFQFYNPDLFIKIYSDGNDLTLMQSKSYLIAGVPRLLSSFSDPNVLAIYLCQILSMLLAFKFFEVNVVNKKLFNFINFFLPISIIATFSRNGWLCCTLIYLLYFILKDIKNIRKKYFPKRILISILVFTLAKKLLSNLIYFKIRFNQINISSFLENPRYQRWINIFISPILSSWGNFILGVGPVRLGLRGSDGVHITENMYLNILYQTGFLGFTMFFLIILLSILLSMKMFFLSKKHFSSILGLWGIFSNIVFLFSGIFADTNASYVITFQYFTVIGLIFCTYFRSLSR